MVRYALPLPSRLNKKFLSREPSSHSKDDMPMSVEMFPVGACLLSAPFSALTSSRRVTNTWNTYGGGTGTPALYTLDEALQLIRFMRGELDIPPLFRSICGLGPTEDVLGLRNCFDHTQAVLVEINSPVAICYGRYALSRAQVIETILNPIRTTPELSAAASAWYNQGLMAANSTIRETTAQMLAHATPDSLPDADLVRAVIVDARPRQRDFDSLVEGLAEIRAAFGVPTGVVTYTYQYMPDGRPLPWPADFVDQTIAVARKLDLPIFQPSEIVRSHGASRALAPDRVHYQPEFAAVLAEALWKFICSFVDVANK